MSHWLYIHEDMGGEPDVYKPGIAMLPYSAVRARQKFVWKKFELTHLYFGRAEHIKILEQRIKKNFYDCSGQAHLGNGASLCAAIDGKSIATTMGFSALDGLMMGTRSGSLDAGVLMYLIERGYTHDQLQDLLYRKSGLLGVSTISADMRKLRKDSNPLAKEAIELFIYKIVRESGAMIACLGGLDLISFSGGIGEHDPALRSAVCKKLLWLGIDLDENLNQQAAEGLTLKISTAQSRVEVWVVPTDEGIMTAQEALKLLHL